MPTQPYHLKDGTRVPGTTTILGRFKEAGGLIHWAWELGRDGKDYREVRDNAADAGTLAHDLVERWIKTGLITVSDTNYPAEVLNKARTAFGGFLEWANQTQLKVTHSEVPLVSERYKFGGTLDAMLVNNKLSLGDWKTANAIYPENLCQLAAYGLLWEENFPDQPIEGGYHILRFGKDEGDFEHRWFGDISDARELFILYRQAYDLAAKLKKRVR